MAASKRAANNKKGITGMAKHRIVWQHDRALLTHVKQLNLQSSLFEVNIMKNGEVSRKGTREPSPCITEYIITQ